MKRTLKRFSFVALSFCLIPFAGGSEAIDPTSADKEVRQKTEEMVQAAKTNDEAWYEAYFADEYLITGQDLQVGNKEQMIEYASTAEELSGTVETDDWQTIVDGDTVISLYKISWKFDDGGTNEARITDVWSHRTGQWLLLAQHVSQISLTGSAESSANEQ